MSSQSRHRRSENGGNGHKNLGPKPVEKDKEYNVEIIEKSAKGDCIAKIQGYIIFIPRGEVGQTVKIRVTHVGERAARAELVDNYRDSGSEKKPDVAPPVSEEEKPELQDYQSKQDTHP